MSVFQSGSAYAMARDIADGYVIVTELTFKQFQAADFMLFLQEADRLLREIRGTQAATTDIEGIKKRQRRLQRVQQSISLAHGVRSRRT